MYLQDEEKRKQVKNNEVAGKCEADILVMIFFETLTKPTERRRACLKSKRAKPENCIGMQER
jgi:hypothetical protein